MRSSVATIEAWATPEIRGGTAPSMRSEPDEAKQVCGAEIDAQAAEHGLIPDKMVIDDLRSYGTAANDLGISNRHERGRWRNNRAENSHRMWYSAGCLPIWNVRGAALQAGSTTVRRRRAQPELAGKAHPSDVLDIVFGPRSRRHAGECVPSGAARGRSPWRAAGTGCGSRCAAHHAQPWDLSASRASTFWNSISRCRRPFRRNRAGSESQRARNRSGATSGPRPSG